MSDSLPAAALDALRDLLGDRCSTGETVRDLHGRDESSFPERAPDAVVFPTTTEEVAAVVRICRAHGVPVVPFGSGSSLEGGVLPVHGGVSLDLGRMARIVEVAPDDLICRVEPGVTRLALEARLAEHGLFFPVDPGADATLGGMAASGAAGTQTPRYGAMRENVIGLVAVTGTGAIVRTGGRARKTSSGYDLTRLLVGSEGTLAVLCELTLRVHGIPERIAAARVAFPDVRAAAEAVIAIAQTGVPVARCELLDATCMGAVNAWAGLDEPASPALFLEFHGSPAAVDEQVALVGAIAAEAGGAGLRWALHEEDRRRLWRARHDVHFAELALRPGAKALVTDVCVPVSRLADCLEATADDARTLPFPAPVVSHAADGNFHCALLIMPDDAVERAAAKVFAARLVERALAMGGTCTGEHGVGIGKRDAMAAEHGPEAVELMRAVKAAFDPDGILNPGKVLPDPAVDG